MPTAWLFFNNSLLRAHSLCLQCKIMISLSTFSFGRSALCFTLIALSSALLSCGGGDSSGSSNINNPLGENEPSEDAPVENEEPQQAIIIETNRFVDPAIRPHLDSFVQELRDRQISADLSNITMEIVDDFGPGFVSRSNGGNIAGLCFRNSGLIQIDATFLTNPSFFLELVYHELGHCVLGMEHRPNSIMSLNPLFATRAALNEFFTEDFFFDLSVLTSPGELENGHADTIELED